MSSRRNKNTKEARSFWAVVNKAAFKASSAPRCRLQEVGDEWLDSPTSIVPIHTGEVSMTKNRNKRKRRSFSEAKIKEILAAYKAAPMGKKTKVLQRHNISYGHIYYWLRM